MPAAAEFNPAVHFQYLLHFRLNLGPNAKRNPQHLQSLGPPIVTTIAFRGSTRQQIRPQDMLHLAIPDVKVDYSQTLS